MPQNLQATLNWVGAFINYQPLTIGGNEPALSIANLVLQTILGPPFCWRFNRASVQFVCAADEQDYTVAAPQFGFIEKAWLTAADGSELKELMVTPVLSKTLDSGRPRNLAVQSDDGAGNLTFRLMGMPDGAYTVEVLYQKKAPTMRSLASTWAPLPDELAYIYQWGVLAQAAMMCGDERFPIFHNKFTAHLLGAQDGLDEMARNIFLGNWLEVTREVASATGRKQQGIAARAQ